MLPFRFKAGGSGNNNNNGNMSISAQPAHHHRSTTKQDHKPFKSKHATKSAIKDANKGKVEREDRGKRRTPYQQVMSKLVRKNQAKQARIHHKLKREQDVDIFKGADGAPKHVAVVPLSKEVDVGRAVSEINAGVDIEPSLQEHGTIKVRVDRYGRNVLFMPATTDMVNAMDVCKLADVVIFVLSAAVDIEDEAHALLKVIEGQGVTNALFVVQDAKAHLPDNKLSKRLAELKTQAGHYFPDPDKMAVLDNKNDCALLLRKICTSSTKGIRWRDARSWMLVEETNWLPSTQADASNVVLSGIIRGKSLNPDRLVHVPGWGEYQIERITHIPSKPLKRKADEMTMDEDRKDAVPTTEQDDLAELAPEQAEMTDAASTLARPEQKGVLLDDHHYFSDDNSHIPDRPAKLPVGTSDYQAAWYLEDVSDSEDDLMDEDLPIEEQPNHDAASLNPEDGAFPARDDAMTDVPATEYPESEMHVDADDAEEARQLAEFRESRKKKEAEEDLEFPDEIELHPDVLARERLAKYRGLKSLRTSEWNTEEDRPYEPSEYTRLLQIPDYKKSYSSAVKESLAGGIPPGTRVEIELRTVPLTLQASTQPSSVFSLLRHEHKQTVVNLNLTLDSDLTEPIKAKEELIVQIGHRRLAVNPIFSAGGVTPNNVHKSDRFLHPGRTAVATFIGPLTWGSIPCLVFKQNPETQTIDLIGTATTLPPSSSRIITKRIILTGHPYKIHKKLVTIRYMFFNREDVEWFKALPLWTKRGRQGFIKEPLGTHGYFKATFDGAGKVNGMDAVGVSLYKRVWPRMSRRVN
ncbi:ribosome biogenesis protein tsr1 [Exophiala xenobiotica]|uniref:Ribosome biogenesis protein tsr1 n=1 Tax=Lithohypha guttulata TaxID=1690604 RepID=A0ABR0KPC1_9EURO|nr:ribosome biogenesis protein tsr1 [Lithohypha guttulata]KAK5330866.1 ribosome biogenesis protein tsr1 [Exophiala xenobiotica]